jgi:hypothetical protein
MSTDSSVSFYKLAHKINKPVIVPFSYYQLLSGKILDLVKDKIEQGFCYIVIIRVKYGNNNYFMAGSNFAFKFDNLDNNNLRNLYDNVYSNIESFLNSTESGQKICEEEIEYFELIVRRVDSKFLTDLRIDSNSLVLTEDIKQRDLFKKQINYFPVTTDSNQLGKQIEDVKVENGIVNTIPVKLEERTFDLMDQDKIPLQNKVKAINKKEPLIFDEKDKFYLRDTKKPGHILAIKQIDNEKFVKKAINFNGVLLGSVVDNIKSNKLVSRIIKEKKTVDIYENEIIYSEEKMELQPIQASSIIKQEVVSPIENPNIGVIDIETYTDSKIQKARVYSAGLYSLKNKKPITFYIDKKTMDNNKVIYDLLDEMFQYQYKGIK